MGSQRVHAQGKGYSTEALRAVVAWGDSHFGPVATVCIIHQDNGRSFRVAEKLGYTATLRAATDEEPHAILVRPGRRLASDATATGTLEP